MAIISKTHVYGYFLNAYNKTRPDDSTTSLLVNSSYPLTNSQGASSGLLNSSNYTSYYSSGTTGKACSYTFNYSGGTSAFPGIQGQATSVVARIRNIYKTNSYFTSINARLYSMDSNTALSDGVSLLTQPNTIKTSLIQMYTTSSAWSTFIAEGCYLRVTVTYNSTGSGLSASDRQNNAYFRVYGGTLAITYNAETYLSIKSLLHKTLDKLVLKTGEQNLLRGSETIPGTTGTWSSTTFRTSGSGGTVAYAQAITPPSGYNLPSAGVIITANAANAQIGFCQDACPCQLKQITQSVWVKGNNGDKVVLQPIWSGTSGEEEQGQKTVTLTDSDWHHLSYTKTPNYAHSSVSLGYVYYYAAAANNKLYVLAPKIEYGGIPTAWTGNATLESAVKISTSFNGTGGLVRSGEASATTLGELLTLGDSGGQIGSIYLASQYTSGGIQIPAGWYNYMRYNFGVLLLGMTVTQRSYFVNDRNGAISVQQIVFTNMPAKGSFTNTSTTNYSLRGSQCYYVREENVVTINLAITCNSKATSGVTFASGAPTHAMSQSIYFPLACETAGTYPPIYCWINSDGTISASGGANTLAYYGSISYITNAT